MESVSNECQPQCCYPYFTNGEWRWRDRFGYLLAARAAGQCRAVSDWAFCLQAVFLVVVCAVLECGMAPAERFPCFVST